MTTRTFHYNGHTLPDPGPQYSNEQVRQHLAAEYFPALGQCDIEVGDEKDGKIDVRFVKRVTTKGAASHLATIQTHLCQQPISPLDTLTAKLGTTPTVQQLLALNEDEWLFATLDDLVAHLQDASSTQVRACLQQLRPRQLEHLPSGF